jgi:hypothetical protein
MLAPSDLLPVLRDLSRVEKLYVMRFLADELAREEEALGALPANCPVWSPYDAYDAAATLKAMLDREAVTSG